MGSTVTSPHWPSFRNLPVQMAEKTTSCQRDGRSLISSSCATAPTVSQNTRKKRQADSAIAVPRRTSAAGGHVGRNGELFARLDTNLFESCSAVQLLSLKECVIVLIRERHRLPGFIQKLPNRHVGRDV